MQKRVVFQQSKYSLNIRFSLPIFNAEARLQNMPLVFSFPVLLNLIVLTQQLKNKKKKCQFPTSS